MAAWHTEPTVSPYRCISGAHAPVDGPYYVTDHTFIDEAGKTQRLILSAMYMKAMLTDANSPYVPMTKSDIQDLKQKAPPIARAAGPASTEVSFTLTPDAINAITRSVEAVLELHLSETFINNLYAALANARREARNTRNRERYREKQGATLPTGTTQLLDDEGDDDDDEG